ncbi:uncharacterized protein isoform X2 [Choristoneura fumiferana]|uniref:uncharacterized protein isoform X2 n=1 Tax=Choristoneura fumiferana TaxID=7141 RepID=UPI003D159F6A
MVGAGEVGDISLLLSPLEASEESDSSETTASYKVLRKNAANGKPLKPLSSRNIQAFFDYFQHESKPQTLLGKLGRGNIHRSMNADVDIQASEIKKPAAPKSKPKIAAKEDVSVKILNYKKVFNVNK